MPISGGDRPCNPCEPALRWRSWPPPRPGAGRSRQDRQGGDGARRRHRARHPRPERDPGRRADPGRARGLPPGPHGFHVHATGACEPPFESAGGHYNPAEAEHGFLSEGGPHAGDMTNITVGAGRCGGDRAPRTPSWPSTATLFDDDGAAILVHAMPDDYATQPSGHAGDRIACGVIARLAAQANWFPDKPPGCDRRILPCDHKAPFLGRWRRDRRNSFANGALMGLTIVTAEV